MKSRKQARQHATADAVAATDKLPHRMAALSGLTAQQLRDEWRRLYRGQPPRLSRDLLIRSIAYRMQELAYGGLSKATQRTLATMTRKLEANGKYLSPLTCVSGREHASCANGAAEPTPSS